MIDKNITEKAVNITGNQVLKSIDLLKMILRLRELKKTLNLARKQGLVIIIK